MSQETVLCREHFEAGAWRMTQTNFTRAGRLRRVCRTQIPSTMACCAESAQKSEIVDEF